FTTIIHLASLLNTASRKYPKQATEINISGSLNILEAASKFGVSKEIYGSSISVYGSRSPHNEAGVLETEPAAPEDIYGAAKRYVEISGDIYHRQYGIQFISLRIASVIGPGAVKTDSRWRSDIIEKPGRSDPAEISIPYEKEAILPFVYVEDLAKMFECLVDAERPKFTVYNTPAETWVLNDLAKYLTSIDDNLSIKFGQSSVTGIPRVINAHRFGAEFNFCTTTLKERLNHISLLNKSINSC
ncbi:MAG: SDR family oxidoreductase, partial [bacterium]